MLKKIYNLLSDNFYFCLFYLFTNLIVVTILKDIPHINVLSKIGLLWGILIACSNFVKIVKRKPNLFEISLLAFLLLTLIFNLIFYRDVENIKIWIVNFVILIGIFFVNVDKDRKQLKKELKVISNFIVVFTFIMSLISSILYITNKTIVINNVIYGNNQGLYIYKNSLAIAAAISILVSVYMRAAYKEWQYKKYYLINIILQIFCLIYAKGMSAYLLLIAIPFVLIFMRYKNKYFRAAMIIIPSVFCIGGFALYHDKLYDFLSARNELWYSAWLSIKNNFFVGIGNSNLVETVYSMRPGVVLPGIEDGGLHNIYLQIFTANGFIGLCSFLLALYVIASYLIKSSDKSYGPNRRISMILLSLLVGILFVNLFESNLIYVVSFISIIFWTYCGYFISIKMSKK